MADLQAQIQAAFEAALKHEAEGRRSPDQGETSAKAAECFAEAARLAESLGTSSEVSENQRLFAKVVSTYYLSQSHKSRMYMHYQRREVAEAMTEAMLADEHTANAVRDGEAFLKSASLDDKERQRIEKMVTAWNVGLFAHRAKFASIKARKKWDDGELLDALDLYRRAARDERAALDLIQQHGVDDRSERITTGNYIAALVNASQVLALLAFARGRGHGPRFERLYASDAYEVVGLTYEAYEIGQHAVRANPEWEEYREAAAQCLHNIEQFLKDNQTHWLHIYAHFEDKPGILAIMRRVDLDLFKKTEQERHMRENKAVRLWAVGSFWLFAFSLVLVGLLVVFTKLGFWTGLALIGALEATFILIGAFVLRSSGDVTEKGLIQLMGLATKFQLKSIAQVFKGRSDLGRADENVGQ